MSDYPLWVRLIAYLFLAGIAFALLIVAYELVATGDVELGCPPRAQELGDC